MNITCLKFHADISYRSKYIGILDNHESRNRAAIIHPHAIRNYVSCTLALERSTLRFQTLRNSKIPFSDSE